MSWVHFYCILCIFLVQSSRKDLHIAQKTGDWKNWTWFLAMNLGAAGAMVGAIRHAVLHWTQ